MGNPKNYDADLLSRRLENADADLREFASSLSDEERDAILNISDDSFEDFLKEFSEKHPDEIQKIAQNVIACFTGDDHKASIQSLTREQRLASIINFTKFYNKMPKEQQEEFNEIKNEADKIASHKPPTTHYKRDFHKEVLHNPELTTKQKLEFCENDRERNIVRYVDVLTRYISPAEKERIKARRAAEIVGMDDAQLIEYYNIEEKVEKLKWARQLLEGLCDRLDERDNPIIEAERRRGKLTRKEREEIAKVEAEIAAEESGADNSDKDSLFDISYN